MVLRIEPIYDAVMDIKKEDKDAKVILMTPDGIPYKQEMAVSLKDEKHLVFICGHYEGFDERIRSLCDMEISIGDYVLTGGELPAMVISDSIIRLLDGVITDTSLVFMPCIFIGGMKILSFSILLFLSFFIYYFIV